MKKYIEFPIYLIYYIEKQPNKKNKMALNTVFWDEGWFLHSCVKSSRFPKLSIGFSPKNKLLPADFLLYDMFKCMFNESLLVIATPSEVLKYPHLVEHDKGLLEIIEKLNNKLRTHQPDKVHCLAMVTDGACILHGQMERLLMFNETVNSWDKIITYFTLNRLLSSHANIYIFQLGRLANIRFLENIIGRGTLIEWKLIFPKMEVKSYEIFIAELDSMLNF